MWDGAKDAKAEMLQVLEQSKFGVPATPYEVYLKILFEKYKRMLTAMESMDDEGLPGAAKVPAGRGLGAPADDRRSAGARCLQTLPASARRTSALR